MPRSLQILAGSACVSCITFVILNPFAIIEYGEFIDALAFELQHAATGHWGYTVSTFHHHVSVSLYYGWGIPLMVLSGCGAVSLLATRKHRIATKWAVLAFPVVYLLVQLSNKVAFQRYALPLLPFLAVLAVYFVSFACRHIREWIGMHGCLMTLIGSVVLLLPLAANAALTFRHNILLGRTDTRTLLCDVFAESSGTLASSRIAAGIYSKDYLGRGAKLLSTENAGKCDIIAMDSFWHDRYIYQGSGELQIDFSKFSGGLLLVISPYLEEKGLVPFSPNSLYSPYLPDLPFRSRPGPYIEIYVSDASLARRLETSLARRGITGVSTSIEQGYYYGKFLYETDAFLPGEQETRRMPHSGCPEEVANRRVGVLKSQSKYGMEKGA